MRFFTFACLAITFASTAQAQDVNYKLGPEDRLRITVHEWRSARNEVYEWTALKGEFTINSVGQLSLPLIGPVQAGDLSTEGLARSISDKLQAKLGLASRPETALEVIEYRPFYILGIVSKPGAYQFRPGMNILQAVSVSGGFYRGGDGGPSRFERETITARGDLRVIASETQALLARRARLEAELGGIDVLKFPPQLTLEKSDRTAIILKEEEEFFRSRRESLARQMESLGQVKMLLLREIDALKAKQVTQERQLGLARRELENINQLVAKGLSVAPRQLSLEQAVAQMESANMDLNLAIIRAEQDVSKTDRNGIELRSQRRNEVLGELRLVQNKIQELDERADTAQKLMYESDVVAPKIAKDNLHQRQVEPVLTIVRREAGVAQEFPAQPTDLLQPGDVIKVERPIENVGSSRGAVSTGGKTAHSSIVNEDGSRPLTGLLIEGNRLPQSEPSLPGVTWPAEMTAGWSR